MSKTALFTCIRTLCMSGVFMLSGFHGHALAQDEQPAVSGFPGFDAQPAVQSTPAPTQRESESSSATLGSTIVGERESPIGLYITPWRNSAPQADLDRPAKLVHESISSLEPAEFNRHVKYYNALSRHQARSEAIDTP